MRVEVEEDGVVHAAGSCGDSNGDFDGGTLGSSSASRSSVKAAILCSK